METVVHVVRHGQVNNPRHVLYERLPGFHLSDAGVRQAGCVAQYLATRPITHLRCSPLERAQETMRPIAAAFPDLTLVTDPRLIEASSQFAGQVMGVTGEALREPRNWPLVRNPFVPSWGEPYVAMMVRMRRALEAAALAADGGQAIIVSHQLPIWITRLAAQRRHLWHDPRRRQCTYCSVTTFTLRDGHLAFASYAEPAADLLHDAPVVGF